MTEPLHTISYALDRGFLRRGLRRDRNMQLLATAGVFAAVAVGFAVAIVVLDRTDVVESSRWGSVRGVVGGIVLGGFVVAMTSVWWRFREAERNAHRALHSQSPSGRIRCELDDQGCTVLTDHSHQRFAWQGLCRLQRGPDVWRIEVVKNHFLFLPPADVTADALLYIEQRCQSAGVRM